MADRLLSVSLRQQESPRTAQGAASASEAPRQDQDPCTGTAPESVTPSRRRDCRRSDSGRSGAALRIGFGVRTTLASDPIRVGELRRRIRKSGTHLGADSVGICGSLSVRLFTLLSTGKSTGLFTAAVSRRRMLMRISGVRGKVQPASAEAGIEHRPVRGCGRHFI